MKDGAGNPQRFGSEFTEGGRAAIPLSLVMLHLAGGCGFSRPAHFTRGGLILVNNNWLSNLVKFSRNWTSMALSNVHLDFLVQSCTLARNPQYPRRFPRVRDPPAPQKIPNRAKIGFSDWLSMVGTIRPSKEPICRCDRTRSSPQIRGGSSLMTYRRNVSGSARSARAASETRRGKSRTARRKRNSCTARRTENPSSVRCAGNTAR